jgi:hypothetical protein
VLVLSSPAPCPLALTIDGILFRTELS